MGGRDYLVIAKELVLGRTEPHWRTAAGRAYYALFLEARDALQRWGLSVPSQHQVHFITRMRLTYAIDLNAVAIGRALEDLGVLRNQADYQLVVPLRWLDASLAQQAIKDAEENIARLDQLEADPHRLATVSAAIRAGRFP